MHPADQGSEPGRGAEGVSNPHGGQARTERRAVCLWDSEANGRNFRVAVGHKSPVPGKSGPEVAHSFFIAERTQTIADRGSSPLGTTGPLRNVGRVGAETFSYDVIALDEISAIIRFRVSNLLIEVNVSEKGKRASTELRGHALHLARQVSEELNSRD